MAQIYNLSFFVQMEAMMAPTLTDLASPPVMGAHHAAFRCRNAAETRTFYEDIFGFPMAQALDIAEHLTIGETLRYMRCWRFGGKT